jgi:hypothetical protein
LGANPDLTPADVSRIMQQTAVDKGAPGKDERYGAGRIDAYQAYLQAVTTSVQEGSGPAVFALEQNYPNPFNPTTTIQFSLPQTSKVEIKVFNTLGEEVSTLISEELPAGTHTSQWSASGMASGVYFYRIQTLPTDGRQARLSSPSVGEQAGGFFDTKKLLLLK